MKGDFEIDGADITWKVASSLPLNVHHIFLYEDRALVWWERAWGWLMTWIGREYEPRFFGLLEPDEFKEIMDVEKYDSPD